MPSASPSQDMSAVPSASPSQDLSAVPSASPSSDSSELPSASPSWDLSAMPSSSPSSYASQVLFGSSSANLSAVPSASPSFQPSLVPSARVVMFRCSRDDSGNDTIEGGMSTDVIIGGGKNDIIKSFGGSDIVIGDYGKVLFNTTTKNLHGVELIESIDTDKGGLDEIWLGDGDDIGIGGADNDVIRGENGIDVLVS